MKNFFAIDISTLRCLTFVGQLTDKGVQLEMIDHFDLAPIPVLGHLYWDLYSVYQNILNSLKQVAARGIKLESIGINTSGCDFCCFGVDGQMLSHPFSLFDTMTEGVAAKFFNRMSRQELYRTNGMAPLRYLTLFQLESLRRHGNSTLNSARRLLFLPDAIAYLLTGNARTGTSIAGTSGLLNITSGDFDPWLLKTEGLSIKNFGTFAKPGETIGTLLEKVQEVTGLGDVPVVEIVGHESISSVISVPASCQQFGYLVEGDISMVGIEVPSITINDKMERLGVCNQQTLAGRFCQGKYLVGMPLLKHALVDYGEPNVSDDDAQMMARSVSQSMGIFNPDEMSARSGESFTHTLNAYFERTAQPVPTSLPELIRSVYDSLGNRYSEVFAMLKEATGRDVKDFFVVGNKSQDTFFNQLLANFLQCKVVAGAKYSAAEGNIIVQAIANGVVNDIWDARSLQAKSENISTFYPRN